MDHNRESGCDLVEGCLRYSANGFCAAAIIGGNVVSDSVISGLVSEVLLSNSLSSDDECAHGNFYGYIGNPGFYCPYFAAITVVRGFGTDWAARAAAGAAEVNPGRRLGDDEFSQDILQIN